MKILIVYISVLVVFACTSGEGNSHAPNGSEESEIAGSPLLISIVDTNGNTVRDRFPPPEGFIREPFPDTSFEQFLRDLPLKSDGEPITKYNGESIAYHGNHVAVIDMEIGDRDLHQCADAVMRLRGEYLYAIGQYDKIHFNFTNGFNAEYSKWKSGQRISVSGNSVIWYNGAAPSDSYSTFWKYLEMVFAYAGTLSLEKELTPVNLTDMQIGDVFIQGGSPGHAVIVLDMAVHPETNEKLFMLAQSYMPAQETHILINPNDRELSPWYRLEDQDLIQTPQWNFYKEDLHRFPD